MFLVPSLRHGSWRLILPICHQTQSSVQLFPHFRRASGFKSKQLSGADSSRSSTGSSRDYFDDDDDEDDIFSAISDDFKDQVSQTRRGPQYRDNRGPGRGYNQSSPRQRFNYDQEDDFGYMGGDESYSGGRGGGRRPDRGGYDRSDYGGYRRSDYGDRRRPEYGDRRRPNYGGFSNWSSGFEKLRPIDWKNAEPIASRGDAYVESTITAGRSQEEIKEYFDEHQVSIEGPDIRPILTFEEATFGENIINQLKSMYDKPTVVQAVSWPAVLSGQNLVGVARTGSGKTLGYLLPSIVEAAKNKRCKDDGKGPDTLVVCPTRELALQIDGEAGKFCSPLYVHHTVCYGGASRGPQAHSIRRSPSVVVGTPGRLLDFLQDGQLDLRNCSCFVLDEADRMLDMGFEPDIRKISQQIPPDRQTLMWTATWPKEVRRLANDFFRGEHVHVNIGSLELAANPNITQFVHVVDRREKREKLGMILKEIFAEDKQAKVLIFTQTKVAAEMATQMIKRSGYTGAFYHGDVTQARRELTLEAFRNDKFSILVATDVAARGLDIPDITAVINFDFPQDPEQYVHRVGRTGRVDKKGTSHTLFTEDDATYASFLIKVLKETNQEINPELDDLLDMGFGMRGNRRSRSVPAGTRRAPQRRGSAGGYDEESFDGTEDFFR